MSEVPPLPPLEKYGPGVRDLLMQDLKRNRHEHASRFLLDLSQFLGMPIESLQTEANMLKILIGKAEKRMDTDTYADLPVDEMRAKAEAFMTDLGNFLQLCRAGETILENQRNGTHEDVKASVRRLLPEKKPATPTESERSGFLDRFIRSGETLGDMRLYDVNNTLLKSRVKPLPPPVKSSGFFGWFRKKQLAASQAQPQDEPKIAKPSEFVRYLESLHINVQSRLDLRTIRKNAEDAGVQFRQFDETSGDDLPDKLSFVRSSEGRCLMIDEKRGLILCDPTS